MIGYNRNDLVKPVMRRAARKWALMENAAGNPTWVYCFDRGLPGDKMKKPGNSGARHTAEIRYVFGTLASSWRPWRKGDWQLSQLMIRYWTNFAKTGNPNGEGLPQWRPYTHDDKCEKHFDITEK
jgi:para-nitrobenzyl esterase